MIITDHLIEAIKDLRYLLSRGYNREGAVRFVADKHRIASRGRHLLMRAVYDKAGVDSREKKIVNIDDIRGEIVSIDGYNLLITVESMLADKVLIACDDHITRDISAVFGKHKITARTARALQMILKKLRQHEPREVHFTYDKQVSKSGELASMTRRMIAELELKGTAMTAVKTDIATLRSGGVVVSSDSVVVQKTTRILDLAGELAKETSYPNLVRLPP